jgi:hypothetical protein
MNSLVWQLAARVGLLGILATTIGCVSTGDELPAVSEEGSRSAPDAHRQQRDEQG